MKDKSAIILIYLLLTLTSIFIFIGVCGLTYEKTKNAMLESSEEKAALNLDLATKIISSYSEKVAVAGFSLASMAFSAETIDEQDRLGTSFVLDTKMLESDKNLYMILERFLEANPQIWGAAVGFEPGVYPKYGEKGFAPFVRRSGDKLIHINLSDERADFRNNDWYAETRRTDYFRWSEPFLDVRGAAISSFCIPIHNKEGEFIGTIAVDLELSKFSDDLNEHVHPYENSSLILLNDKLKVIAHPDTDRILKESKQSIKEWEKELRNQGMFLYSSRIAGPGWTVALICPEEEVIQSTKALARKLLVIALIGILLSSIASVIAFTRIKKFATNQISVNRDLHIASILQQNMLPHNFPTYDKLKLAAILQPAKEVGGDLYDFFIEGNKLVFSIGDVSGKGVPASIIMAVTKAIFRSTSKMGLPMSEVAHRINTQLSEGNENGMFVTMFLGELNLDTGEMRFCNAGHNPIVLIPESGDSKFLKAKPNLALGLIPEFPYEEEYLTLPMGTRMVLYTDGVTEAETADKHQYGEDRLLEWCNKCRDHSNGSAKNAADALLASVKRFTAGNEQNDDITIMTIKLG